MMLGFLLLLGYLQAADIKLELMAPYEAIPEALALTSPGDMVADKLGNLYLLDRGNKCLYSWDGQGKFHGTTGKPGNGPGELSMENGVGRLVLVQDELWVFDESARKVSIWNLERNFLRTVPYPARFNRVTYLVAFQDQVALVNGSTSHSIQELLLIDKNMEILRTISTIEWKQYIKRKDGSYLARPLAPQIQMSGSDEWLFFAPNNSNEVSRYNLLTGSNDTTLLPLVPQELSPDVIGEYTRGFRKWARPNDQLELPEKSNPIYAILALKDQQVLILTEFFDAKGLVSGLVYHHPSRKVSGRFSQVLHTHLQGLTTARGQLLVTYENGKGELTVAPCKINYGDKNMQ